MADEKQTAADAAGLVLPPSPMSADDLAKWGRERGYLLPHADREARFLIERPRCPGKSTFAADWARVRDDAQPVAPPRIRGTNEGRTITIFDEVVTMAPAEWVDRETAAIAGADQPYITEDMAYVERQIHETLADQERANPEFAVSIPMATWRKINCIAVLPPFDWKRANEEMRQIEQEMRARMKTDTERIIAPPTCPGFGSVTPPPVVLSGGGPLPTKTTPFPARALRQRAQDIGLRTPSWD
jgi:hypothetical protein